MKTYATLGPACCRAELLTELLDMGLTGFRLNLSHTTLTACRPWTEAVQQAREASGRPAELIGGSVLILIGLKILIEHLAG